MPIEYVWGLVVALIGTCFLVVFDDFRTFLTLKNKDKEITTLRQQLNIANREYEKKHLYPQENTSPRN